MLLKVTSLSAGDGNKEVVHDFSVAVNEAEVVGLIGHNGAGKTTALKAIYGVLKPFGGEIVYGNESITARSPSANVKGGIFLLPQERYIFPDMSVKENLQLASGIQRRREELEQELERVYKWFPVLRARANQAAEHLSGGERRMLGIGMALMVKPKLLMLDEPSLGLSPLLVRSLNGIISGIARGGVGMILVEQNVKQALSLSNRVYVLRGGRIVLEDTGQNLLEKGEWWNLF